MISQDEKKTLTELRTNGIFGKSSKINIKRPNPEELSVIICKLGKPERKQRKQRWAHVKFKA